MGRKEQGLESLRAIREITDRAVHEEKIRTEKEKAERIRTDRILENKAALERRLNSDNVELLRRLTELLEQSGVPDLFRKVAAEIGFDPETGGAIVQPYSQAFLSDLSPGLDPETFQPETNYLRALTGVSFAYTFAYIRVLIKPQEAVTVRLNFSLFSVYEGFNEPIDPNSVGIYTTLTPRGTFEKSTEFLSNIQPIPSAKLPPAHELLGGSSILYGERPLWFGHITVPGWREERDILVFTSEDIGKYRELADHKLATFLRNHYTPPLS